MTLGIMLNIYQIPKVGILYSNCDPDSHLSVHCYDSIYRKVIAMQLEGPSDKHSGSK